MHVVVSKKDLLRVLGRCHAVADKKSTMPVLGNVLIETTDKTVRLAATDLVLAVSGEVEAEVKRRGSVALGAKDLFDRVRLQIVQLEDTIRSFKAVVEGEYDHLPEAAFYMVGGIDEAVEKAKKMAAEAA